MKKNIIYQQQLIPVSAKIILEALDNIDANTSKIFNEIYSTHIKNKTNPSSNGVFGDSKNIFSLNGASSRNNRVA